MVCYKAFSLNFIIIKMTSSATYFNMFLISWLIVLMKIKNGKTIYKLKVATQNSFVKDKTLYAHLTTGYMAMDGSFCTEYAIYQIYFPF